MRLEDHVYWEWEFNGDVWGFDPRTGGIHDLEKFYIPDSDINKIVKDHLWKCVRAKRDYLLKECDWVSGLDVPESIRNSWFPYRQALRDITDQDDPDNIVWPDKPV